MLSRTVTGRSDFALTMLLMLDRISYDDYERAARMFGEILSFVFSIVGAPPWFGLLTFIS